MSLRMRFVLSAMAAALASHGAFADTINVTSYDMNNGNGTASLGTYNYLDGAYSGTSPKANSTTEGASLTGGTGILTNGIIPTVDYTQVPSQYVGWKYTDPTLNFYLQPGSTVSQISLYFANPVQVSGSLAGGLVGIPGQVLLSVGGGKSINATFSSYALSSLVEVATFSFANPLSYTALTDFEFTLDRGPLLADGIEYHHMYPGPAHDALFDANAYVPDKEPWIMLSEVQFTTAVPEPSTWLLMIIGFAGLSFASYRRKIRIGLVAA